MKNRFVREIEMDATDVQTTKKSEKSLEGTSFLINHGEKVIPVNITHSKDIYTQDKGPKMYDIKGSMVTSPIIPLKLPEAFKPLIIHGRPDIGSGLEDFRMKKIREFIGPDLDDEEFDRLTNYCSPIDFTTGDELTMPTLIPVQGIIANASIDEQLNNQGGQNLCIRKKHKLRIEHDTANHYARKLKYRSLRVIPMVQIPDPPMVNLDDQLQPGKDIIFRVRVYRPFSVVPNRLVPNRKPYRPGIFSCDVVLCGRNMVTDLRDRIICPNDVSMRVDQSDAPDELCTSNAKDLFRSGFLFINNSFYVDTRPGCRDMSKVIRDWAVKKGIGEFPLHNMSDFKVEDMVIKLGHPDVYVHQGNCEHIFIFSEIRLLNSNDPLLVSQYPCHSAIALNHMVYCTTCAEFGAKWVVTGCERVPFDPAFFCEKCFKEYLYVDGCKVGNFRACVYKGNELNTLKPQD